jgi:hypothetical protein
MLDIIAIAQTIGDREYQKRLPNLEAASEAYTVNTQAALDALREVEERRQSPKEMYNALVNAGEDPDRAAHLVDMEFGFADPMPDPFAPVFDARGECGVCKRDCRTAFPSCEAI